MFEAVFWLLQTFTLAGACAGLTEAVIVNPFEVVKVQLQAERSKFLQVFAPSNFIHL